VLFVKLAYHAFKFQCKFILETSFRPSKIFYTVFKLLSWKSFSEGIFVEWRVSLEDSSIGWNILFFSARATRDPEHEVLPTCEELGIGFVPWSPLGMGYLTGKVTASTTFDPVSDLRASAAFPRFTPKALRANRSVVELLERIAQRKNATQGQIDLAWLLSRKSWIVPIPGTTKLNHIKENLGAVNVKLNAEDIKELEDGFAKIKVQGKRAPEALLKAHDIGANFGTSSKGGHGLSPLP
jgi:hypothetical protein